MLSTDHELIPVRNASLAAMHGSARESNVQYYPTWKHSPLKERNEQVCYNACTARCFQLGYKSLVSLSLTNRKSSVHLCALKSPPHCTKEVYSQQGSTRDLWTVATLRMLDDTRLVKFTVLFLVVLQVSEQQVCSRCNVTANPIWLRHPHLYRQACLHRQQPTLHTLSTRISSTQFNSVHKVKSDTKLGMLQRSD
jgi:hypothetical protein